MAKDKISRRDFIKGMGAGAASIAAMGVLSACGASETAETTAAAAETVAAAAETAAAVSAAAAPAGGYTPGTYTASAQGLGTVTMTATFDEKSITDIELDFSQESDIGKNALEELRSQLMAAQGPDIDGVSGATLSSNAVRKCMEDCIAQASGGGGAAAAEAVAEDDSSWLGEAPDIDDSMCSGVLTADVVVVGCGIAGIAACRAAAEDGASVIAIEKAAGPQCRSGEYAVINGSVQARWGRDTWTADQINAMCDFHVQESNYKVKRAIFSKWAHNIDYVFDWWIEPNPELYIADSTRADIPDEYADNFLIPIFHPLPEAYHWENEKFPCYPTSVEFLPNQSVNVEKNMQAAVDTGLVDAHYGCFAEKLIMEDGRCTGVYMRESDSGRYYRVNAQKGVILSTGDYSQNEAMVRHFCPDVIENGITRMFTNVDVEGNFTNQGDGIKLGMWAGAKVQQCHAPMIHHMGGGADLEGVGVMGIAGFLNIDLNGRRFMNEDLPGQQIENQIELQKDMKTWQIFDSAWPEQLPYMPAEHGGACYYEDYESKEDGPRNNQTYRNYKSPYQLEAAVADGRCVMSNSIKGLLNLMFPDDAEARETALQTIERYNEMAREGYDADFGKNPQRMWPLENPPFYADMFEPALLLVICGGLESDENCHTFDEDRNIIPGLYVAGNVQGSRFAAEYPITLKGVSHSLAMFYGYCAGKNAAGEI